ncbi:metal ABC transporter substrate-binding protein [Porticoccaceae bacterium LTM1]|nr:metal ABC transporter substrate-binding protein [Porticoccaceae bacterium LTM1]
MIWQIFRSLTLIVLGLGFSATVFAESANQPIKIVTTIKPLALVIKDIGADRIEVHQLIPDRSSPHDFAMRVSDRVKLDDADLVVHIGEGFDGFIEKMVPDDRQLVTAGLDGLIWPEGEGCDDPSHHHDDEHDSEGHHHHHHHDHGKDLHLWLNPENINVLVTALAARLSELDPEHAEQYLQRANSFSGQMQDYEQRTRARFAKLPMDQFVVQHDAYGHFVEHFGLKQLGSLRNLSGAQVGAKSLAELLAHEKGKLACILVDPQFNSKPAEAFAQRTGVATVMLDPLGSEIAPGENGYLRFLENVADAFERCLNRK